MAYDSLTNDQLAAEARDCMNTAENAMQAAMRRMDELILRGCHCDHSHEEPPVEEDPHHHEPEPAGDVLASSVPEIASNFDVNAHIVSANIPPSSAPDVVGAFRMTANVSHLSYDDPIVFPGQPGVAHLHVFYGNTLTDAHSTYESLRTTGGGTTEGGPINRTAYWHPALILGDMAAIPEHMTIYYKRLPQGSERIPAGVSIAPLPRGLRMLVKGGQFRVYKSGEVDTGYQSEMGAVLPHAAPGRTFYAAINFPHLWDGERVDSPDHMAHMGKDAATHPFLIPTISLITAYTIQEGEDWRQAAFASDLQMGQPAGSTYHADYWEAWDTPVFREIEAHALDKMLNCSGGNMGSGRKLTRPPGFTFNQRPNRVALADVPARLIS